MTGRRGDRCEHREATCCPSAGRNLAGKITCVFGHSRAFTLLHELTKHDLR